MSFKCYFCNNIFSQKKNVIDHLNKNRCKSSLINDNVKINEIINEKQKEIDQLLEENKKLIINGNHNHIGNNNNINMKVEIIVNSINNLDINYIDPLKMKEMIDKFNCDPEETLEKGVDVFSHDKVNLLLGDYIKDMICNKEHPENHAVKYIKKKPPTYNTQVEDADGTTISVIKGLKDTCELLTDPILDKLKIKMTEFIKKYRNDDHLDVDIELIRNAIIELRKELNKNNVKKALNSVLRNDILNNIEMRLKLEP